MLRSLIWFLIVLVFNSCLIFSIVFTVSSEQRSNNLILSATFSNFISGSSEVDLKQIMIRKLHAFSMRIFSSRYRIFEKFSKLPELTFFFRWVCNCLAT